MSRKSQIEKKADVTLWDTAIADAEKEIKRLGGQLSRLKSALASFKQNRELGIPWPGSATRN